MDPYLAQVIIFAGNFAPRGWAYCHGQLVSIAEQTALFALIGTTYGGDGQVTFAYPNLQGRVPVGTKNNGSNIGEVGGVESRTLISSQIPPHIHPATVTAAISVTNTSAGTEDPVGGLLTETSAPFYASSGASTGNLGGAHATVAVGPNVGGNQPVYWMPPYLAINYIICIEGIFPSRN